MGDAPIRAKGIEVPLPGGGKVVIDNLQKDGERILARVQVYDKEGTLADTDRFPIDSHKKRKELINRSAKKGIAIEEEALLHATESAEQEIMEDCQGDNPPPFSPTEQELQQAESILKDKPLLYITNLDIGICQEQMNILILFLVCISRLLPKPISVLVKGESGSGKTTLVMSVVRSLLPEGQYKEITRMSAKVLERLKSGIWDNMVIILSEVHSFKDNDYQFRILMSEGQLTLLYLAPEGDDWEFKERVTKQKASFISTTIRERISDEAETRTLSIYVDDSPEHMAEVKEYMARLVSRVSENSTRVAKAMQIHLMEEANREVIIPYLPLIAQYVPGQPRDFARFRTLLEASAMLHAKQRPHVTLDGQEYIVSTLSDYNLIRTIFQDRSFLPTPTRAILDTSRSFEGFFTRKDLQKALGWTETKLREYVKYLEGTKFEIIQGSPGVGYMYCHVDDYMPSVEELSIQLARHFEESDDEILAALLRGLGGVYMCMQKMKENCYDPITGHTHTWQTGGT